MRLSANSLTTIWQSNTAVGLLNRFVILWVQFSNNCTCADEINLAQQEYVSRKFWRSYICFGDLTERLVGPGDTMQQALRVIECRKIWLDLFLLQHSVLVGQTLYMYGVCWVWSVDIFSQLQHNRKHLPILMGLRSRVANRLWVNFFVVVLQ